MANYDVDLELLLGKPVVDPTDTPVGVIEEIRAEKQGGEWVMQAYLIDSITMLERLSIWTSSLEILHLNYTLGEIRFNRPRKTTFALYS